MRRDGLLTRRPSRRADGSDAVFPTWITGLVLRLDAALGIEIGTGVSAWADQSGIDNHASQGSPSLQPTYEAKGWNGAQPSILFTAASAHVLEANGIAAGLSGDDTPWTITWAVQRTSSDNPGGERYVLGLGQAASSVPAVRGGDSSGTRRLSCRDDGSTEVSCLGNSNVVTTRHQFTYHFDGTTRSMFVDGALEDSDTTALGTSTFDRFYIGKWRTVVGYNLRTPGLTVYDRALTTPELATIWQYNRDRFGGLP